MAGPGNESHPEHFIPFKGIEQQPLLFEKLVTGSNDGYQTS